LSKPTGLRIKSDLTIVRCYFAYIIDDILQSIRRLSMAYGHLTSEGIKA
jgi:hypothetical protein